MTVGCYFHPPFDAALAAKVDYVKSKITWFWSKIDLQISAE